MKSVNGNSAGMIRAVIFDMDGTLTVPRIDWIALKTEIGIESGPVLEHMQTQPPEEQARILEILERHEHEAALNAEPGAGLRELFCYLEQRGIKRAIVTRNSRKASLLTLSVLGVKVDALITREDAPPKPDPKGLLLAAEAMGCDGAECMMVGDYKFDIMAGKSAGMRTALVGRDARLKQEDYGMADHAVESLDEIIGILDSLARIENGAGH
ncbi:MAG TPA: HAD family hydrolase [Candidatus Brocadiia bacterium]|nr:HAD family hydrolase [Candidatus Brocadiia bacterium]